MLLACMRRDSCCVELLSQCLQSSESSLTLADDDKTLDGALRPISTEDCRKKAAKFGALGGLGCRCGSAVDPDFRATHGLRHARLRERCQKPVDIDNRGRHVVLVRGPQALRYVRPTKLLCLECTDQGLRPLSNFFIIVSVVTSLQTVDVIGSAI